MQKLKITKFLDSEESKTEKFTPINTVLLQFKAEYWQILRKFDNFHVECQFLHQYSFKNNNVFEIFSQKLRNVKKTEQIFPKPEQKIEKLSEKSWKLTNTKFLDFGVF